MPIRRGDSLIIGILVGALIGVAASMIPKDLVRPLAVALLIAAAAYYFILRSDRGRSRNGGSK